MTVLPIIAREMRTAARQPFTYYSRTMGVAAFLAFTVFFAYNADWGQHLTDRLFGIMHMVLFSAIWLLVPSLAADCISRERREGTLGLLFMTGLTSSDIVVAKGLVHGLRALTVWLAVLPAVTIPFLLGGLTWTQCLISVLLNFSSICWAIAAGLIASAFSSARVRALLGAIVLTVAFLLMFNIIVGWRLMLELPAWRQEPDLWNAFILGSGFNLRWAMEWQPMTSALPVRAIRSAISEAGLFSLSALALAVLLAGARIRRLWQDKAPSRLAVFIQAAFCTPILCRSFFKKWLRRKLDANPIGWLERRTWTGRVVSWGWLAVVVSIYSAVLSEGSYLQLYRHLQHLVVWLMLGSMAFTAAGSFRRERETGLMELLLVSPLREEQLIWGRLRGLWGQFLPAFGLLLGIWAYSASFANATPDWETMLFPGSSFLCLPLIGLYCSLRCRGFIPALLATLIVALFVPALLVGCVAFVCRLDDRFGLVLFLSRSPIPKLVCQLLLALACGLRLLNRLKHRNFPLGRQEA